MDRVPQIPAANTSIFDSGLISSSAMELRIRRVVDAKLPRVSWTVASYARTHGVLHPTSRYFLCLSTETSFLGGLIASRSAAMAAT